MITYKIKQKINFLFYLFIYYLYIVRLVLLVHHIFSFLQLAELAASALQIKSVIIKISIFGVTVFSACWSVSQLLLM